MAEPSWTGKILIMPSWYPSHLDDIAGVFVREQARCLGRRFHVDVLTPRFPSLKELLTLRWGPDWRIFEAFGIREFQIRKLKIPTLRRYVPFLCQSPDVALVFYRKFMSALRRGFHRYVRAAGLPDLIHTHVVLPAGWMAVQLGKEFGVPVVLTEHSEPFAPMHLGSPTLRQLAREALLGAQRVIAVSDVLRETIHAFCPDVAIDVIGNVIDTDYFAPAPKQERAERQPFKLFFLGHLTERKGAQFLLRAVRMLLDQGHTNFTIRLGGDGPYRGALERLTRELNVATHCKFLGALGRPRVLEEMQACDVFVLPSLGETFGVVLGEAMACGKPVLSTRCGGPEFVVTPATGVLVKPGDPRELADALARFLTGQVSFSGAAIRRSVTERFGANAFLDRHTQVYRDVMRLRHVQAA